MKMQSLRSRFSFVCFWVASSLSWTAVQAQNSVQELQVPAATAYSVPDSQGIRISGRNGVTRWDDPAQKLVWYGQFTQTGKVHVAIELRPEAGKPGAFQMKVGEQSLDWKATSQGTNFMTVPVGSFFINATGYQRFELEWKNAKGEPAGEIRNLILTGSVLEGAHFNLKPRRNAASVHWGYPVGKGTNVAAFYCEAEALADPVYTYYMACGWHRGYFGMQVNSATERRIIFSVWDSGKEAVDRKKVDAENRVTLMGKGEGVFTGDFGNEGTGGHSHLKYLWKTGEIQRFLVTCQPTNETFTVFSGYYWHPDRKDWMLISSWRAPKEGGYLRGLYSFSENFGGDNGNLLRKARFGRQWIRTDTGEWMELTHGRFTHDATGKQDRRDRFGGVEKGAFFLSHGGFVDGFTPLGTTMDRPATGELPEMLKQAPR